MSKGIGIAIVAAAIAALSLTVGASAYPAQPDGYQPQLRAAATDAAHYPDGYQPQLGTAANDAAHYPDGYQPQFHTDSSDVISRYLDRTSSTVGVGLGRETPDGFQPQLHGREAVPNSGSDGSFDWRIFGIATGSALMLAMLGGIALIATRTRGRVAHS
jgi:hypothetical protein